LVPPIYIELDRVAKKNESERGQQDEENDGDGGEEDDFVRVGRVERKAERALPDE
jgi:hypothetical protein